MKRLLTLTALLFTLSGYSIQDTLSTSFIGDTVIIITNGEIQSQNEVLKTLQELENTFNRSLNNSIVNQVNLPESKIEVDLHFKNVFDHGKAIYNLTNEVFNPAVWDILKAWEFHEDSVLDVDLFLIDSLLSIGGLKDEELRIEQENDKFYLIKPDKRTKFAFDGLLNGYVISLLDSIISKNHTDYMIRIGKDYLISNNIQYSFEATMIKDIHDFCEHLELPKPSFTKKYSGSFSHSLRRYYRQDGTTCNHVIDTKTGLPSVHNLIAVEVYHTDPIIADALATTFMVDGPELAQLFLENNMDMIVQVNFIYQDKNGNCKFKRIEQ